MSTTAQRAMERLARAINQAFPQRSNTDTPVKCEALGVKSGGVAGTGIRLTIGNRVATFDENGQLVGVEEPKAAKPDTRTVAEVLEQRQHAVMGGCCNRFADQMGCDCLERAKARETKPEFVNPPPPAQTRPGDFSRVDLSHCQPSPPKALVPGDFSGVDWKCSE